VVVIPRDVKERAALTKAWRALGRHVDVDVMRAEETRELGADAWALVELVDGWASLRASWRTAEARASALRQGTDVDVVRVVLVAEGIAYDCEGAMRMDVLTRASHEGATPQLALDLGGKRR
jgi:hypothetical protein